jgi:hypothetical protein
MHVSMEIVLRRMKIENATVTASDPASGIGQATSPAPPGRCCGDGAGRNKAEQAYRRSDALAKRRKLMEAWAAHSERARGNVVVPIAKIALTSPMGFGGRKLPARG